MDAADGAAVVGGAVHSGAVGGNVLGVVEAADDDGAVGVGVDEVDQDFVANARQEVGPWVLCFMVIRIRCKEAWFYRSGKPLRLF